MFIFKIFGTNVDFVVFDPCEALNWVIWTISKAWPKNFPHKVFLTAGTHCFSCVSTQTEFIWSLRCPD